MVSTIQWFLGSRSLEYSGYDHLRNAFRIRFSYSRVIASLTSLDISGLRMGVSTSATVLATTPTFTLHPVANSLRKMSSAFCCASASTPQSGDTPNQTRDETSFMSGFEADRTSNGFLVASVPLESWRFNTKRLSPNFSVPG